MVFIHFLLRQKHLLDMQQRRYDALAQFNDTLLFEYDIVSNCVVLTPNALERLDLDERYLEGIPGEYYVQNLIHPDDREHILKDILTGVYNRSAEMLINNLLKKDEQGLFFMLDLDDFR